MVGLPLFVRRSCRSTALAIAAAVVAIPLVAAPAAARGPDGIADVAEKVINAVVNISTSQNVDTRNNTTPQLPPGSPFEEFFDEFFKNRRNNQQGENQNRQNAPHRVSSLGSGFIIDPSGIVVTNNHVIADADEVTVILNDGTPPQGRDPRPRHQGRSRAPAGEAGEAAHRRVVRRLRQAAARRMGGRDRQPVQPRRHRHRRHRLGAQPRHQFRSVRQLHPDRRRHQSRQFRRPAVQSRGRGHRHQHRDHLAVRRLDRHRLRGSLEDRGRRHRPAAPVRRDAPRLARRAHPAGRPTTSPRA